MRINLFTEQVFAHAHRRRTIGPFMHSANSHVSTVYQIPMQALKEATTSVVFNAGGDEPNRMILEIKFPRKQK